jgi:hypothetical protein
MEQQACLLDMMRALLYATDDHNLIRAFHSITEASDHLNASIEAENMKSEKDRRRDMALDKMDDLESMSPIASTKAWIEHQEHINTSGNEAPECLFCYMRIDLDWPTDTDD